MSDLNLTGEVRSEFGKGAARRIRRAAQIPAVIYGHGAEPLHIVLPERATVRAIRGANALLIVEHIDLLTVKKGEKVIVDVPVVLVGEPAPAVVVNQEEMSVSLSADATHLPAHVEVDINGREAGHHILASDLTLPANVELLTDPSLLIVHLAEPAAVAEADETAAEAAPAAE
jgi:large subunit ribosomal protein L25